MKLTFITYGALFLSLFACRKECLTPPEPFRFILVDASTGKNVTPEKPDQLRLYYVVGQTKFNVEYQLAALQKGNGNEMYIQAADIPWISLDATKSKHFFIEQVGRPTADELVVDVVQEATSEKCKRFSYQNVLFNSKSYALDRSLTPYVYVLPH